MILSPEEIAANKDRKYDYVPWSKRAQNAVEILERQKFQNPELKKAVDDLKYFVEVNT